MSHRRRVSADSLRMPPGVKKPPEVSKSEKLEKAAATGSVQPQQGEGVNLQAPAAPAEATASPVADKAATAKEMPSDLSLTFKESLLAAKLKEQDDVRARSRGQRPKQVLGTVTDPRMDSLMRDMEAQLSYKVPAATKLPDDFLDSIGMSGETVLISAKAVAAIRAMMGGTKRG